MTAHESFIVRAGTYVDLNQIKEYAHLFMNVRENEKKNDRLVQRCFHLICTQHNKNPSKISKRCEMPHERNTQLANVSC